MIINFYKYQATGNDFVMIDDRRAQFPQDNVAFIRRLCDRRFGIGGDGLILLREDARYDFRMIYFNSDGKEGSMCGNGGRCAVLFAKKKQMLSSLNIQFLAADGLHEAQMENSIRLKIRDVTEIRIIGNEYFINTGSPHCVIFRTLIETMDVVAEGRKIRHKEMFRPDGVNVNFVDFRDGTVHMRTYERGVENETLSCGTGSVAAAIAVDQKFGLKAPSYNVRTPGGPLKVLFVRQPDNSYTDIWLEGPAEEVFSGSVALTEQKPV